MMGHKAHTILCSHVSIIMAATGDACQDKTPLVFLTFVEELSFFFFQNVPWVSLGPANILPATMVKAGES